jgi:type 1 fimbria pilin
MEENIRALARFFIILVLSVFFSTKAIAFSCTYDGLTLSNSSGTFTVMVDPVNVIKSATQLTLVDMSHYGARCNGSYDSYWKDSLQSQALTISSELTNRGYAGFLKVGGTQQSSPLSICLWPDANCTFTSAGAGQSGLASNLDFIIGLKRDSGSGNWHSGGTIPAGTEVARLTTLLRTYGNINVFYPVTWIFKLSSKLEIPGYTCLLDRHDEVVSLPAAHKTKITEHGIGRYPDATKEFKLDLTCDPQTTVSIKFEGTPLGALTNVLKNSYSGNDNVGIQILYGNTPLDVLSTSTLVKVVSNAQNKEILTFNAYYYYRGGDISGGPIKSQAMFTLDYK